MEAGGAARRDAGPSLAAFLARPAADPPEELRDGVVVRRPALAAPERWLRSDLATLLYGWARAAGQGAVATAWACVCGEAVLVPDVVYFAPGRAPERAPDAGATVALPDLAVEVCGTAVDPAWHAAHVAAYLAAGVRLAWLVDAAERTVTVFGPQAEPVTLDRDAVLEAPAVLPGFFVHLADLFAALDESERESV